MRAELVWVSNDYDRMKLSIAFVFLACTAFAQLRPDGATASFKGSLPPKPTAALSAEQQGAIDKRLAEVTAQFQAVKKHERAADADIFLKAVRYALEFHEWYDKKTEDGAKKANALLDEAVKRIDLLKQDTTPWMNGSGQKVLGFYSKIDDSPQPYGVEVPEGLEFGKGKKPVPMWVWLHGRGDTTTDLHFVYSRLMAKKPGQFQPKGTIVIHPFGRYCNGWKSAGETDVFEARDDASARFNVDENRIALAGFSMGGAGAWHIGAHFADQWACVHTGAGFVDVKRYQKVTPDKLPPWYEQVLWGVYDVPDYALNFKNVPLISYSGEIDTQRDGAEYMTEVFAKYGMSRPHLIGPGMGHKYHPDTLKEVQTWIEKAVDKGRDSLPKKVMLQTKTSDYNRMFWISLLSVEKQWNDARIEAEYDEKTHVVSVKTTNVSRFAVWDRNTFDDKGWPGNYSCIDIDGQKGVKFVYAGSHLGPLSFCTKVNGQWGEGSEKQNKQKMGSSSIDEAFKGRFIVVLPDGRSADPKVDAWVTAESSHFLTRWRSLMRGDVRAKKPSEVTDEDQLTSTLVMWGTPESNSMIRSLYEDKEKVGSRLPIGWTSKAVVCGQQSFDRRSHIPCFVTSKPILMPDMLGSIVLNSGLTFREAHDKTNSLQNPKLPHWAILDITQPPNAESAGKVVAADFFDEHWQVIPRVVSPESREIPK